MPNVIPGCELILRDGRAGKAQTFLMEAAPQALKRVHLNPNTAFTHPTGRVKCGLHRQPSPSVPF